MGRRRKTDYSDVVDIFEEFLEEWKPIDGYEGLYDVSTLGRVRSVRRNNRILKQEPNERGYMYVKLFNEGKGRMCRVARLVGLAFLGGHDDEHDTINHLTENKRDNSIWNLAWCSFAENQRFGTRGYRIGLALCKPFVMCRPSGTPVRWFRRLEDAKRAGYGLAGVLKCLHGEQDMYKGYRWVYDAKMTA